MKRLMILALMALGAMSAHAQQDPLAAPGTYRVNLEVTRGGDLLGAPLLVMTAGKRDRITLKDGADTIVLEPLLATGSGSASLDTIVTIANQSWRPVIGVAYGDTRSFAVERLSVRVKIEPVETGES